jgi:transposase
LPLALPRAIEGVHCGQEVVLLLLVGDDWAEDHHDVEVQDERGRVLGKARLPEGVEGIARLHALIGKHAGDEDDDAVQVVVGIETDRGPWVQALVAAGYQVYPINPLQAARYRERHGVSGAKSDSGDAHALVVLCYVDGVSLHDFGCWSG